MGAAALRASPSGPRVSISGCRSWHASMLCPSACGRRRPPMAFHASASARGPPASGQERPNGGPSWSWGARGRRSSARPWGTSSRPSGRWLSVRAAKSKILYLEGRSLAPAHACTDQPVGEVSRRWVGEVLAEELVLLLLQKNHLLGRPVVHARRRVFAQQFLVRSGGSASIAACTMHHSRPWRLAVDFGEAGRRIHRPAFASGWPAS